MLIMRHALSAPARIPQVAQLLVARRRDIAAYFPSTVVSYNEDDSATVTAMGLRVDPVEMRFQGRHEAEQLSRSDAGR